MARPYILLTPDDGGLWQLARAVARQSATEPLDVAGLAQRLCAKEAGDVEVNKDLRRFYGLNAHVPWCGAQGEGRTTGCTPCVDAILRSRSPRRL